MPEKPFDDLETLNTMLYRYKGGESMLSLSYSYAVPYSLLRRTIIFADVPRYRGGRRTKSTAKHEVKHVGKYDYLIFEPVNPGHDYKDIVNNISKKPPLF